MDEVAESANGIILGVCGVAADLDDNRSVIGIGAGGVVELFDGPFASRAIAENHASHWESAWREGILDHTATHQLVVGAVNALGQIPTTTEAAR